MGILTSGMVISDVRDVASLETLCYRHCSIAGWSSLVARRAHNPKVVGSNPAPATKAYRRSEAYRSRACLFSVMMRNLHAHGAVGTDGAPNNLRLRSCQSRFHDAVNACVLHPASVMPAYGAHYEDRA